MRASHEECEGKPGFFKDGDRGTGPSGLHPIQQTIINAVVAERYVCLWRGRRSRSRTEYSVQDRWLRLLYRMCKHLLPERKARKRVDDSPGVN